MQKIVLSAVKDSKAHNYSYADLASCWAVIREPLTANGLSVTQWPQAEGKKVTVTTVLMHTSGQWMRSSLSLDAKDASCQAVGSAITYARRYALGAACGIAPDDDDDGKGAMPDHRTTASHPPRLPYQAPRRPAAKPVEPEVFHSDNQGMQERLGQWLEKKGCPELHPAMAKAMNGKLIVSSVLTEELDKLQLEG